MLLGIVTCVWQIPFLAYEFAVEIVGSLSYKRAGTWIFPSTGFASFNLGETDGEE